MAESKVKAFYLSKTVWVNIILTALAIIDLASQSPFITPEILPWLVFGAGVLNLVLRIWFTDSAISFKK